MKLLSSGPVSVMWLEDILPGEERWNPEWKRELRRRLLDMMRRQGDRRELHERAKEAGKAKENGHRCPQCRGVLHKTDSDVTWKQECRWCGWRDSNGEKEI